jgi:hypothetical protein
MQLNLSYITNSHTKFVVVLDEFSPREDLLTKVRAGRCIHATPPPCTFAERAARASPLLPACNARPRRSLLTRHVTQ